MTGSTTLYLKPKHANYFFKPMDKREIFLMGLAEHPSFSKDMDFLVEVYSVDDDFVEVKTKIPAVSVTALRNAETVETHYGDFKISHDPDSDRINIRIYFRHHEFEKLLYFTDKCFFSSNATMNISFTIAKVELGYEPVLDKIPIGESLPIIDYAFSMNNFQNPNKEL